MPRKKKARSKAQSKKVDLLDQTIEGLDETIHDMSPREIDRTVAAFSQEGVALRSERKKIRYQLYRLRTEQEGKCAADSSKSFRSKFESQGGFGGWAMFATTWDVACDDPYRIVNKELSEQDEWNEVVASKFPQINPGGGITYPDINVRKKIEAVS